MKLLFQLLRAVLGPVLLLKERLTAPTGIVRTVAEQARVDAECADLALYQFRTCPFCIKVRQQMRRLSLSVTLLDAQHSAANRQALQSGGGSTKVPCLRISAADGSVRYLYESKSINQYLQQRFGATSGTPLSAPL
ncbi:MULTISPECIES: glutaredoxin family protein [unclassified Undibacterium]|uniref:glutaredoxin family protein n=1 Tax=unclassified Undibacterium TaxID=2630295 RepID=UPI002AC90744|nr:MULTISPECIES: glutaredoxin domain-containing protein [unclassified Undibacterium]MEB0137581.1 glutathione S-transferase N-terminal domain-containing protein [Undibacterium sp. CCC2.1]MEB0170582.1 glutathione S-transferase N-terminal domain-containing protein [Undibacterium sp. CCC1.1]MEB0174523.1 glutathione S-transferase N-terminal domain-containing protein [Undibacterium sp. CCC3.4]MEB0213680.1 glutathione S-transferase N-terminal domain-containing protein [Undibacterium sp. 5I2]WPX43846.